jgi:NTP pyrophosphatase (non-canonical NTP hydrolase)
VTSPTAEDFAALHRIAVACYENSDNHGFHDQDERLERALEIARAMPLAPEDNPIVDVLEQAKLDRIGNQMMLIVGEVAEGHEEVRKGHAPAFSYYPDEGKKPEGVPSEIADLVIRAFDFCGQHRIDIAAAIAEKMGYNATRPMFHGGKKF